LSAVIKLPDPLPPPDPLGFLVSERPDHIGNSNGWRY
jgi:hypothetical protein